MRARNGVLFHPRGREEGSFLFLAVLFLSFVLTMVYSAMTVVNTRVQDVRASRNHLVARNAAESGIQRTLADIRLARDLADIDAPFAGIDQMDANMLDGDGGYTQVYSAQDLNESSGARVAEYDVVIDVQNRANATSRTIALSCFAYAPNRTDYDAGVPDSSRSDAHCTVTVSIDGGGVFDYSYFINHWGWFYGNNIVANGSVRSNGQFDFGGYTSAINGSPRYTGSNGALLTGYQDDNNDGLKNGTDGGTYAGMAIVGESGVTGMGALAINQHEYQPPVAMPNLSDLGYYETKATAEASTVKIGGTTIIAGVLGDSGTEKQNVFLEGTAASPIQINGRVVVRGSVVIKGYVTGQGSIIAGGNVFVAGNINYVNPPTTPRPASNDQATVEAWRAANMSQDALGLFAKEHLVVGDSTNSYWQSYVSSWINHPLNRSDEDAGADQIHGTSAGRDGVYGTADDDTLEHDGVWTVDRYTSADQAAGRIPAGKSVGDVIPGSGEDIDGDGVQDGPIQMSEFAPPALSSANFAGNVPAGTPAFSTVSSINIKHIDGALYTNHALPALMIAPSGEDIVFNGAIVSRNESIIYGARYLIMNHDERLSGHGGDVFGFKPPLAWQPMQVSNWEFDVKLPAGTSADPDLILSGYTGQTATTSI